MKLMKEVGDLRRKNMSTHSILPFLPAAVRPSGHRVIVVVVAVVVVVVVALGGELLSI